MYTKTFRVVYYNWGTSFFLNLWIISKFWAMHINFWIFLQSSFFYAHKICIYKTSFILHSIALFTIQPIAVFHAYCLFAFRLILTFQKIIHLQEYENKRDSLFYFSLLLFFSLFFLKTLNFLFSPISYFL